MQTQRLLSLLGSCGCQRQCGDGSTDSYYWRGFSPASGGQMFEEERTKRDRIPQSEYQTAIFEDIILSR